MWRNVVEAGPLKEQFPSCDIQFCVHFVRLFHSFSFVTSIKKTFEIRHTLEYGIDNPLLLGTTPELTQVPRHRLVHLKKASLLVGDTELMLVRDLVVSSPEFVDGVVMLIQDSDVAVAVTISGVVGRNHSGAP